MKIEVVRVVRAELNEEEFEVIASALSAFIGEQWTANPKHKIKAVSMRDELMIAFHGEPEPF